VKRSDELAPLSRDHHRGLFVSLGLRRATDENAAEARDAFVAFWGSEGAHHFRVEEAVLLPGFARHAPADHEAVVRVLVEHVDLRRRAYELSENADVPLEALHELGTRLRDHIRHEEDVLFPLIERTLPAADLVALGEAIARAEAEPA
jgi:hemerythrin-like domain-containing protein